MFGWLKSKRAADAGPEPFGHLRPGRRYRVVRAFLDHDGIEHPVGERWTFLSSSFLPYEDGLSLFVAMADGPERQIRMQRRPGSEGRIIDSLHDYVLPDQDDPRAWTLLLTRDSVCMGDDIDAPHAAVLDVPRDADAAAVARAIMADGYCAWVGSNATWSLALGSDRVVFGYRHGRRFVRSLGPQPLSVRAEAAERVDVRYWAQVDPDTL